MSESNQRSKTLIRELYELSESGALDQIDSKVVDSACDFIQNFINPVVTYKQAAKISGQINKLDLQQSLQKRHNCGATGEGNPIQGPYTYS